MTLEIASSASRWTIGDPGRAATELAPGPPVREIGHADIELTSASFGGMLVRAATVRGLLHVSTAGPRQDAFALGRGAGDSLIAAVCDGVGSLGRSHEAADLVSRLLVSERGDGRSWPEAFTAANTALHIEAEQALAAEGAARDTDGMATTAIGMSIRRVGDEWVGEVAWAGDSTCWRLGADGRWLDLAGVPPEDDEYYSGRVRPLPSTRGTCEVTPIRLRDCAIFLMSDGVANPLRWARDVQDTLAGWWSVPPEPLTFAGQVGFVRKTHLDDRTVVGVWLDGCAVEER